MAFEALRAYIKDIVDREIEARKNNSNKDICTKFIDYYTANSLDGHSFSANSLNFFIDSHVDFHKTNWEDDEEREVTFYKIWLCEDMKSGLVGISYHCMDKEKSIEDAKHDIDDIDLHHFNVTGNKRRSVNGIYLNSSTKKLLISGIDDFIAEQILLTDNE